MLLSRKATNCIAEKPLTFSCSTVNVAAMMNPLTYTLHSTPNKTEERREHASRIYGKPRSQWNHRFGLFRSRCYVCLGNKWRVICFVDLLELLIAITTYHNLSMFAISNFNQVQIKQELCYIWFDDNMFISICNCFFLLLIPHICKTFKENQVMRFE